MNDNGSGPAAPARRLRRPRGSGRAPRRLSSILLGLIARAEGNLKVADLVAAFGERSFGALLLIFAAPNIIPLPPGASTILAIPLFIVSIQLTLGFSTVRLPKVLAQRELPMYWVERVVNRLVPWLRRIERVLSPRFSALFALAGERVTGLICLILSLLLFLPIPFTAIAPAVVLTLLALGILQKDGWAVVLGWICAGILFILFGTFFGFITSAMYSFWTTIFAG